MTPASSLFGTTGGEWVLERGFSDWGLPCLHTVVSGGEVIAEIPSVTPYCIGARKSDIETAKAQLANARALAQVHAMLELVAAVADETSFAAWLDHVAKVRAIVAKLEEE